MWKDKSSTQTSPKEFVAWTSLPAAIAQTPAPGVKEEHMLISSGRDIIHSCGCFSNDFLKADTLYNP